MLEFQSHSVGGEHPGLVRLEAGGCLIASRLALTVLPFPRLARLFARHSRRPPLQGISRRAARNEVRGAVVGVSEHLPGMTCFARAIAAQAMLRRRGVATTLLCGGAVTAAGLDTHVWLTDGAEPVVGCRVGRDYTVLARYPAEHGTEHSGVMSG